MVDNVYGNTSRATGDSTHGQNTVVHFYDKAGVRAANTISVYAQHADRRSMPLKMGTTYKVSKWLHPYDRETDAAEFSAKGYLTARSIVDVTAGLDDSALSEGAGAVNKRTIKKVTIETNFARYGEMIDYSDEVDMFAEDAVQVHYREELGHMANRKAEDLIQLDMLATTTVMYSGTATSLATIGNGVDAADGSDDDLGRVSYDLIRKATRKLVRNRAEKTTSMVTGSTKIDTRTVNRAFYAIIGPEVKYDLENQTRGNANEAEFVYIPVNKYGSAANLAEGEVGAMNDMRFVESESQVTYAGAGAEVPDGYVGQLANTTLDAATATALNAFTGTTVYADGQTRFDAFPILIPTKGSFATVGLKGHGKIKFNSKSPKQVELINPYGTQGFFSYNMWYAGIILREERLLKVLVAASS